MRRILCNIRITLIPNIAWYSSFLLLRLDSLFRARTAAWQARGAVVQRKDQVIQLLQGMAEKGKKEKHEEQVLPFPHPLHNLTNLYWACHRFLTSSQLHSRISSGCVLSNRQQAFPPQVQFAAYKQFCDDTTVEKQRAIKEVTARERNDPTAGLASPDFFPASFGAL